MAGVLDFGRRHSGAFGSLVVFATLFSSSALAQTTSWPEAQICSAGTYTYFFLESPPRLLGNSGKAYRFQSAAGHIYDCELNGDRVNFTWNNAVSGAMSSHSTKYQVAGEELTIVTDLVKNVFVLAGNTWTLISR
ncbi:hypothetical protein [Mesorhizobium sp. L103C119B0]|uniref:hypothetical protein n=1 Tax=Mesorhizobium sp. L103C119B0 TaxID=1287085 RepID=UPI0012DDCA77|nr:hypothetical protein [Mesorhizobium sp. L103C119B0]